MATTILDTFTDANGTDLNAHTPDSGGGLWVRHGSLSTAPIVIDGNKAYASTIPAIYYQDITPSNEFDISFTFDYTTVTNSNIYLCGAVSTSALTYYNGGLTLNASGGAVLEIYRTSAGTATSMVSMPYTVVAGQAITLRFVRKGTILTLTIYDAVQGYQTIFVENNTITAAGVIGIRFSGTTAPTTTTGPRIDGWQQGIANGAGTVASTQTRTFGRHTLAQAGGLPLSDLITSGKEYFVDATTSVTSGTGAHWQGVGSNKIRFPTPASNGSLADASYVIRIVFNWSDGTTSIMDVTVNILSAVSVSSHVTEALNDPELTTLLAAEGAVTFAGLYTVADGVESANALAQIGTVAGVAIYYAKGVSAKSHNLLRTGTTLWSGKWAYLTNEDNANPSEFGRVYASSGSIGPIIIDSMYSTRSADKGSLGGVSSGSARDQAAFHQRSVAGPIIYAGVKHFGNCTPANTTDSFNTRDVGTWTYVSGSLQDMSQNTFGAVTKNVFRKLKIRRFVNNCFFFQGTNVGARDLADIYVLECANAYGDIGGFHPDVVQFDSTVSSFSGGTKIRRVFAASGNEHPTQNIFNVYDTADIDMVFYCGPAQQGFTTWNGAGGTINRITLAAQPDTAMFYAGDPALFPNTAPNVDTTGGTETGTYALTNSFVWQAYTKNAGDTQTNCTVAGLTRNADGSAYFVNVINAPPTTITDTDELIQLYMDRYSGAGTLVTNTQGALFSGLWADGTAYYDAPPDVAAPYRPSGLGLRLGFLGL